MRKIWGRAQHVQGAGFPGGRPSAGDVFDNSAKMLRFKSESIVYARAPRAPRGRGGGGGDLLTKSKLASGRLGTKRQCLACGAKYYDLGRQPPVCSRCGARAEPKRAGEQAGAQAAGAEKVDKAQRY